MIELLVVLGIIGILIGILLPAVQYVRESARLSDCQNRIRQIGLAATMHHDAHKHLPTGGWGYGWLGDFSRGFGREQPGGWIYSVLPYMEAMAVRELGRDQYSRLELMVTPLEIFRCPTRSGASLSPATEAIVPINSFWLPNVAKTDFAFCEGDFVTDSKAGPGSISSSSSYDWAPTEKATGVCFQRSQVRFGDVTRGLSNTYLGGEKFVSPEGIGSNVDPGYDQSMYCGIDIDIVRWSIDPPLKDTRGSPSLENARRFGSSHSSGSNFVFCDGSVRLVTYDVDPNIHRQAGVRK